MKKIFIVMGIVVFFLIGIVLAKDFIIKSVVTQVASKMIGAKVHMDGFSLSLLKSTINVSGFKIYNPSGFPEGILVSCPTIKVIYDREALLKNQQHFLLLEIELKEMGLTKNKEGKLNVDSLKIVKEPKSSPTTPMQIDLLNLKIGKIVYKDYTTGSEPSVRVHDVNKQHSYKSIPSAQQLALLVLAEPMKAAAIKNAQIYGVAMLSGVAFLPVAVAATFIGQDSVQEIVHANFDHVYKISLEVVGRMGKISKDDASNGAIKANIKGSNIALALKKKSDNETEITISARKYMLPQPDIAGGVLYQILDKLLAN